MVTQVGQHNPIARPDLVLRRVANEWVLFDATHGRAHVLNLTAAVIWTYCDGAHPTSAIADAIARAVPDTAPERLKSDVDQALRRFADEGLLQ